MSKYKITGIIYMHNHRHERVRDRQTDRDRETETDRETATDRQAGRQAGR